MSLEFKRPNLLWLTTRPTIKWADNLSWWDNNLWCSQISTWHLTWMDSLCNNQWWHQLTGCNSQWWHQPMGCNSQWWHQPMECNSQPLEIQIWFNSSQQLLQLLSWQTNQMLYKHIKELHLLKDTGQLNQLKSPASHAKRLGEQFWRLPMAVLFGLSVCSFASLDAVSVLGFHSVWKVLRMWNTIAGIVVFT